MRVKLSVWDVLSCQSYQRDEKLCQDTFFFFIRMTSIQHNLLYLPVPGINPGGVDELHEEQPTNTQDSSLKHYIHVFPAAPDFTASLMHSLYPCLVGSG